MSDWFQENAPPSPQGGGKDWFASNAPATTSQRPATSVSMALDFMQGGGAELISTALGAYNLLRKIPGADKVLPPVSPEVQQYAEPPHTVAAKLGGIFTTLGEFAVPGGAAADITKGAGLLARSGAQALAAGGVEAARSGGDVSKTIDTAALGAAGPVIGAGAKAALPFVRNAPGAAFDAGRFLLHPTPASALRIGQRIAGAAGKAAEETAPAAAEATPAAAADPLLDKIAQGYGVKDFQSLRAEDQDMVRGLAARMTGNAAPAAAAPRGPYVPRPPEYYGVKPAQTPPPASAAAPEPAPAPVQPAPAASPEPPPPAAETVTTPEAATKPSEVSSQQPKTPADIAKARFAQAKADRFVKAIQSYNERFNAEPITSDAIAGLDDAGKSVLTRALKSNGLLNNTETFTDTSFPYIVTKLRQSEYARR